MAFNFFRAGLRDLIVDKNLTPSALLDELKKSPNFHSAPFLGDLFSALRLLQAAVQRSTRAQAFPGCGQAQNRGKITRAGELPASSFVPPGIEGYASRTDCRFTTPKRRDGFMAEAGYPAWRGFPSPPSSTTKASKIVISPSSF